MSIEELYELACQTAGDINEHLPTLLKYAEKCEHITELGTGSVISTLAFLYAKPKKFITYDCCYHDNIMKAIELAAKEEISMQYINANDLDIEIEPTDLLFIDTFHHNLHLKRELAKHAGKVKKYIILHDIVSYGWVNENMHPTVRVVMPDNLIREYDEYPVQGIMPAIDEFLSTDTEWHKIESFENNNGLLIIGKDDN